MKQYDSVKEKMGVLFLTSVSPVEFGGVETLTIRMAEWCVVHDIPAFWVGMENPVDGRFVEGMKKLSLKDKNCFEYKENRTVIDCVKMSEFDFSKYDRIVVLGIGGIDTVVAGEMLRKRYPETEIELFFYVVGPYALCYEPTPVFARFTGRIRKNAWLVRKMIDREMIVFMDTQCLDLTRKSRRDLTFPDKIDIKRLPMNIGDFSDELVKKRFVMYPRKIVTCTRFDFPFKEYVVGLIDVFDQVYKKYPDVELVIIGGGDGLQQLQKKINTKEEHIKKRIKIIPSVPYSELSGLLKDGFVYVGMGTTLLDSCSNSLPCLMTYPYNNKCETNGFFCDHWDNVGEVGEGESLTGYLVQLLEMNEQEYSSCARRCYDAYKSHYDIDLIMREWIAKRNTDNTRFMSAGKIYLYNFVIKLIGSARKFLEKRKG